MKRLLFCLIFLGFILSCATNTVKDRQSAIKTSSSKQITKITEKYFYGPYSKKKYLLLFYKYKIEDASNEWATALLIGFKILHHKAKSGDIIAVLFKNNNGKRKAYVIKESIYKDYINNKISKRQSLNAIRVKEF